MGKQILIVQGCGRFLLDLSSGAILLSVCLSELTSVSTTAECRYQVATETPTARPPQIGKTGHLERSYAFGQELYPAELTQKN